MLADFCFADVLLYGPARDGRWLVMGHVRPVTGQTLYLSDWVGSTANESELTPLQKAYGTGEMVEGEITVEGLPDVTRLLAIPVRRQGRVIAVMTKEWSPWTGRQPGELQCTYQAIFHRFAAMIAEGCFPFDRPGASGAPVAPRGRRRRDGASTPTPVWQYASPNVVRRRSTGSASTPTRSVSAWPKPPPGSTMRPSGRPLNATSPSSRRSTRPTQSPC